MRKIAVTLSTLAFVLAIPTVYAQNERDSRDNRSNKESRGYERAGRGGNDRNQAAPRRDDNDRSNRPQQNADNGPQRGNSPSVNQQPSAPQRGQMAPDGRKDYPGNNDRFDHRDRRDDDKRPSKFENRDRDDRRDVWKDRPNPGNHYGQYKDRDRRDNDRFDNRYNRYEGRYNGKWDDRYYHDNFRRYGYGKAKYVYYHDQRVYRAPYFSGVICVRPPYYRGMPKIIYPAYRYNRPVVVYRPIWSPDYTFVRRFVFFPRINLYWDNIASVFVYNNGGRWISSTRLPSLFVGVNISLEPMFEVEEDSQGSNDGFSDNGNYYYEY